MHDVCMIGRWCNIFLWSAQWTWTFPFIGQHIPCTVLRICIELCPAVRIVKRTLLIKLNSIHIPGCKVFMVPKKYSKIQPSHWQFVLDDYRSLTTVSPKTVNRHSFSYLDCEITNFDLISEHGERCKCDSRTVILYKENLSRGSVSVFLVQ